MADLKSVLTRAKRAATELATVHEALKESGFDQAVVDTVKRGMSAANKVHATLKQVSEPAPAPAPAAKAPAAAPKRAAAAKGGKAAAARTARAA